jgi:hypothetical protein
MATKQIQMAFQVQNNAGETNTVQVQLNGVTKFEGTLPETGPLIIGGDAYSVTNITFDQDVEVVTASGPQTANVALSVTVSGGSISLEDTFANYTRTVINTGTAEEPVWTVVPGTAENFVLCNVIEQPTWNGEALLDRYNIEYNLGPVQVTGPGQLVVYPSETVQTTLAVGLYNNQ